MDAVIDSVMKLVVDSPNIALWVLVIIYGFKVVIVGSIYGTIRFVVAKVHDAYTQPRVVTSKVEYHYDGHVMGDAKEEFTKLLTMLTFNSTSGKTKWISNKAVTEAVDILSKANFDPKGY